VGEIRLTKEMILAFGGVGRDLLEEEEEEEESGLLIFGGEYSPL
jgi:hypothetical protein